MVLQKLYDDLDVGVIIFYGDDAEDVGCVLSIGFLTVLVGKHQAGVSFFHLYTAID